MHSRRLKNRFAQHTIACPISRLMLEKGDAQSTSPTEKGDAQSTIRPEKGDAQSTTNNIENPTPGPLLSH